MLKCNEVRDDNNDDGDYRMLDCHPSSTLLFFTTPPLEMEDEEQQVRDELSETPCR
jgi:hypothetical protein